MRKYVIYISVSLFVIALSINDNFVVDAKSIKEVESEITELEKEQRELQNKKSKIDSNKAEVSGQKDENIDQQISVQQQMNDIEDKLTNTKEEITTKESEIEKTTNEMNELTDQIQQLTIEIEDLKKRIEIRDELLRDRLRSIQESGGKVQYISVIFGSQSFSDFVTRSTTVNTIMDQDKNIMEEHAADQQALEQKQKEVEEKKQQVEEKKKKQEQQKKKLQSLKNQLDEQKAEKESLKKQLQEEYEELEDIELSLEEEQQLIDSEARVIEEAKKLAEAEMNKLEQEAREREKQRQAAQQESNSSNSSNSTNNSTNVTQSGGGSSYVWPASGRFSSSFGPRTHPITGEKGKMHNGIDISAPTGTPVVASASGVVAYAGWMNGYGNTIMIAHGSATTLYAHLSRIDVSSGISVSQGQTIGAIGSTGNSTGPHLHFEIHPGGYKNPANPVSYLP